jgi:hypothetical protein
MRTIFIFCALVTWGHAVDVTVPEDRDMMIFLPDAGATPSIVIAKEGKVTAISDKFSELASSVDAASGLEARKKIFQVIAAYKASSVNAGGPGYSSVVVTVGMAADSVAITWAWNEKKQIPMPEEAKKIYMIASELMHPADDK